MCKVIRYTIECGCTFAFDKDKNEFKTTSACHKHMSLSHPSPAPIKSAIEVGMYPPLPMVQTNSKYEAQVESTVATAMDAYDKKQLYSMHVLPLEKP